MRNNKIRHFTDLDAWKEGHKLVVLVYKVTGKFPKEEKYNLTSQSRRAVVSITNNIAEGFCRFHYKDRLNFYYDARGSVGEIQNCMIAARDTSILENINDFEKVWKQSEKTYAILNGLIEASPNTEAGGFFIRGCATPRNFGERRFIPQYGDWGNSPCSR